MKPFENQSCHLIKRRDMVEAFFALLIEYCIVRILKAVNNQSFLVVLIIWMERRNELKKHTYPFG